jgi:hypothetical protein
MEFSWSMVGAISTIITVIGVVALLWLRSALAKDFTPNAAFSALSAQVRQMEHDLRTAPTHSDIRGLSDRVRAVEVGVAVVQETVSSLKDGMGRIDKGVQRIEQHLLETNK